VQPANQNIDDWTFEMTGRALSEPHSERGLVESIHASGGETTSRYFQFKIKGENDWFLLNPLAEAGIFSAMAGLVTAAFYSSKEIRVVSYIELANSGWQVSFVETT
jgi:hypothetical protein